VAAASHDGFGFTYLGYTQAVNWRTFPAGPPCPRILLNRNRGGREVAATVHLPRRRAARGGVAPRARPTSSHRATGISSGPAHRASSTPARCWRLRASAATLPVRSDPLQAPVADHHGAEHGADAEDDVASQAHHRNHTGGCRRDSHSDIDFCCVGSWAVGWWSRRRGLWAKWPFRALP
jgi:hypothetical protein